ncbi:peptidase M24, structural domain-containing protein [Desarmillaria tabescens]|uniref:Peptidase M24, structural domain-containing protein n=1 Tax=Armillaria tabescens TaxID=1929756 RepID=A0AA39J2F4_ARMTA|nr:peptidase M24, structural domain-containing protein [Desarmillaria tabescens]KAK0434051.1 peptidase M24, structural domain-containing protein [Desarmillaria tabescens]
MAWQSPLVDAAAKVGLADRVLGWYLLCLALVAACLIVYPYPSRLPSKVVSKTSSHCSHLGPLSASEFHTRLSTLGKTLTALNASAYIAEPGASALYYANISTPHWHLSERPLLLIADASARVTVLTPKFKSTRALLLSILSDVMWVPYSQLLDIKGTVFVDGSIRHFIVDGLRTAFPKATVIAAPTKIRQLRERKSEGELALLKRANEVHQTHKQMHIGMRESDARNLIARALADAGLKDGGCLTLFGENAALPHGSGTDRRLRPEDFALFDCTASLHGYWSDVTRTLALPASTIPKTHLQIWNIVHSAQNIAFGTAHAGVVAKRVDEATRFFLDLAGYAKNFTHRLGHGIGLEVHEDPNLNGGNEVILQTGHTFSDEPRNGSAMYLTAGVGGPASSPWKP